MATQVHFPAPLLDCVLKEKQKGSSSEIAYDREFIWHAYIVRGYECYPTSSREWSVIGAYENWEKRSSAEERKAYHTMVAGDVLRFHYTCFQLRGCVLGV